MSKQHQRRERFRVYMRDLLRERGVSMRSLSLTLTEGKDAAYVQQLVGTGRKRALPSPDQCRLIASTLKVPFAEVLQRTWGIDPNEIAGEIEGVSHGREGILRLSELAEPEFEEVKNFVAWVRAKRNRSELTEGS